MSFDGTMKEFLEICEAQRKMYREGEEAFEKDQRIYHRSMNPYVNSPSLFADISWQHGYQAAYYKKNSPTMETEPSEPEYNFRSLGEDNHIDRYAGRGL